MQLFNLQEIGLEGQSKWLSPFLFKTYFYGDFKMKVDIQKLREKVDKFEAEEAERIDKTIKNNDAAIKALTRSETRAIERQKIIDSFEELAREFELIEE